MDINEASAALKARYRTDRACANHVGMTPQHFEALRNGRAHIKKSTADLIILKAMTAAQTAPAPATVESVSEPQQAVTG